MGAVGLVASRYLVSRRPQRFIAVIAGIAVTGVALGVAALIVTLAVMTGFDEELQGKIVGASAHVIVQADGPLAEPEQVAGRLAQLPGVTATAPFVQGQVLLQAGGFTTGAVLRGVDPAREPQVTALARHVTEGPMDPGPAGLLLGQVLAQRLGVRVGDSLGVITPTQRTPRTLAVAGLLATGMYDYDSTLAVGRLATAQALVGLGTAVTGVGARVAEPLQADRVKRVVQQALGYPYWATTWMEQNRNLFAALKLEKVTMFLILTLIVLVACFTIVATLLMMVIERIRDVGILRALGATTGQIWRLFTVVGLAIGGAGIGLGLAGGVGLCEFLRRSRWVTLPADIYYVDHLPVQMVWQDIGLVLAAAGLISWLACLYPASVAARLAPVEALRYE